MKRAALEIAARELSDLRIRDLREAFESLDSNGDGKLSVAELADGLERSGLRVERLDVKSIVARIDGDLSGAIDYTEFLAAALDRNADLTEDILWTAFNVFDQNGDGKITTAELQKVLRSARMPWSCVADIIRSVDVNGDGTIDFEEFAAMLKADRKAALMSVPGSRGGA